jgi:hypothetical protein
MDFRLAAAAARSQSAAMAESSQYACEVCPAAFMAPALEFAHAVRTRGSGCTRALCEVTVNVRRVPCVSSALARHVRGHTGELPHKCDVRPAGFTTFLWDNITHEIRHGSSLLYQIDTISNFSIGSVRGCSVHGGVNTHALRAYPVM